ncbi:hypothetical protein RIF29_20181 [Crotalaria pallida]|uniref:Uncharacterized protein n=1 Tax=Crotalaria pallida TaxID=3830 RepID=A0AAN9IC47_CROPI
MNMEFSGDGDSRVSADNILFEEAFGVYDYVERKGLVIEEKSRFVLLFAMKKRGRVELASLVLSLDG